MTTFGPETLFTCACNEKMYLCPMKEFCRPMNFFSKSFYKKLDLVMVMRLARFITELCAKMINLLPINN